MSRSLVKSRFQVLVMWTIKINKCSVILHSLPTVFADPFRDLFLAAISLRKGKEPTLRGRAAGRQIHSSSVDDQKSSAK